MQKGFRHRAPGRCNQTANQTDPSPWTVVAQNMNQSAQPPRAAGVRWAGVRLALSLLPAVAISGQSVAPEPSSHSITRPYLAAVGAPALRFGEAVPPPDLSVRPAAGAPPQPIEEHGAPLIEPIRGDVTAMPPTSVAPEAISSPEPIRSTPSKPPPAILPDDTRPKVRAEDFLPFFQFPGSASANGDVTVVAPVPSSASTAAPLPASSATYRQQ